MPEGALTLRDLLAIVFKRKWQIALVFGLVFGGALAYSVLRLPVYEGRVRVLVKLGKSQISALENVTDSSSANLLFQQRSQDSKNELEIIRSTTLDAAHVEALRTGAEAAEARQLQRFSGRLRWGAVYLGRTVADAVRAPAAWLGLIQSRDAPQRFIEQLNASLQVEALEDTDVIAIAIRWTDPDFAVRLANEFLDAYLAHHVAVHEQLRSGSFYHDQVEAKGRRLGEIEDDLAAFLSQGRIADLGVQKEVLLRDLADLDSRHTDAVVAHERVLAKIQAVQKQVREPAGWIETPDFALGVSDLASLDQTYFALFAGHAELLDTFEPDARALRRLEEQMGELRQQKASSVLAILDILEASARRERGVLASHLESKRKEMEELRDASVPLLKLERERSIAENSYLLYRRKAEEVRVSEGLDEHGITNVSVVQRAEPSAPVWPRKGLILSIAGFLALILGLAYALLLEFFDHSFKTEDDLVRMLDAPVLATLPDAAALAH